MTQKTYTPNWSKAPADNDCPVLDHDSALDNWRDTLTVRPFQDRDIPQNLSDYFTGKTSFISAYVDLLLARMARDERFSDDEDESSALSGFDLLQFDLITFQSYEDKKVYAIVSDATYCQRNPSKVFIMHSARLEYGVWERGGNELLNTDINYVRTITELEILNFRLAMEAVYG